jgi:protein TonB
MWSILALLAASASAADLSPEAARWAEDAKARITRNWNGCVDNLGPEVPLPEASYTTVASVDVTAQGAPSARIVGASGSEALDRCALDAVGRSTPLPVPPASMVGEDGLARISELKLTLQLARSAPPPAAKGPLVAARRDPAATAAAVAAGPTRVGILADGAKNVWCGASGGPVTCDIRDKRGSMLVFTVSVCTSGEDLRFDSVLGPIGLPASADLAPGASPCP